MPRIEKIVPNLYRDSLSLMELSARLCGCRGITRAAAVMASKANLDLLAEAGLSSAAMQPRPHDILLVIEGSDESSINDAMKQAQSVLHGSDSLPAVSRSGFEAKPSSIAMAVEERPSINLALISTPGEYAAMEAAKALRLGLNVMLFSSNISIDDEVALKRRGRDQGLLVMGPDCGTAIINGVPLGFANVIRRGSIGVIGASGTGLQEVTCLIDRAGLGISQAIGTGGRDLSERIGGVAMLQALGLLDADDSTQVIVLISKPPAPTVAKLIRDTAQKSRKPVVINFLGDEPDNIAGGNIHAAATLEDAAQMAVLLAGGKAPCEFASAISPALAQAAREKASRLSARQKYVRGLYSGGTLCYEALNMLGHELGPIWSNTPLDPALALPDVWTSRDHTVVDLGDDRFTRGRPHPMIDPRLRNERLMAEAADRETAVILVDVVLGYGAHADPASAIAGAIAQAREKNGRPAFVASICGTAGDHQSLDREQRILQSAGVLVAPSNAAAARLAAQIALAAPARGHA